MRSNTCGRQNHGPCSPRRKPKPSAVKIAFPVTLAIMMEVTRHQRHSARLRHWTQGLQSSPLPLASRVCQHFSIDATRRRTMCSGCAQWRSQCGSCSRRHRQTGTRSSQPTIVGSASGEMVPSQCSPQRLHPVAAMLLALQPYYHAASFKFCLGSAVSSPNFTIYDLRGGRDDLRLERRVRTQHWASSGHATTRSRFPRSPMTTSRAFATKKLSTGANDKKPLCPRSFDPVMLSTSIASNRNGPSGGRTDW